MFLSPPWGGLQYLSQPAFSVMPQLGSLGVSLAQLLTASRRALQLNGGGGGSGDEAAESSGGSTLAESPICSGGAGASPSCSAANSTGGSAASGGAPDVPDSRPVPERLDGAGQQRRGRRGVVAFLPKNTDLGQLSKLVPQGGTLEVERNILDGFFKGITTYFWEDIWCT